TLFLLGTLQLFQWPALLGWRLLRVALCVGLVILVGLPRQRAYTCKRAIFQRRAAHLPAAFGTQHQAQSTAAQQALDVNPAAAIPARDLVAKAAHQAVYIHSTAASGLATLSLAHNLIQYRHDVHCSAPSRGVARVCSSGLAIMYHYLL